MASTEIDERGSDQGEGSAFEATFMTVTVDGRGRLPRGRSGRLEYHRVAPSDGSASGRPWFSTIGDPRDS